MLNPTPMPTRRPPQSKAYPVCNLKKAMDIIKSECGDVYVKETHGKGRNKVIILPEPYQELVAITSYGRRSPMNVNEHFGYNVSAKLKAMKLPSAYRKEVILLAEMVDSVTPRLQLYTMDKKHMPIDQLCIYEQNPEKRDNDSGIDYLEYFITTKYEITLMMYYQSRDNERKPELLNSRRFIINKEGMFEETIIELE